MKWQENVRFIQQIIVWKIIKTNNISQTNKFQESSSHLLPIINLTELTTIGNHYKINLGFFEHSKTPQNTEERL